MRSFLPVFEINVQLKQELNELESRSYFK